MKRFDGKVFVEIQINFIMATLFGADECSIWTDCLLDLVFINNFFYFFCSYQGFQSGDSSTECGDWIDARQQTEPLRNLILKKFPFMHGNTEKEGTGIFYACFNKKLFKSCDSFVILFR